MERILSLLHACLKTAVIIATKDRCDLLASRALPAVVAQTHRPDFLIVCDDSSSESRSANFALLSTLELPGCEVIYQVNHRSEGASGCWNSAVDTLFSRVEDPNDLLLAFLDDDDAWAPTYLESCIAEVAEHQLDMVAAGLRRIESANADPLLSFGPERLAAADFLISNPGIQGSNLCLRLGVFLQAGGFDEELKSTTDRDLCIRLADLGTVRYARLPQVLVDHYADSDRDRLSIRGSEAKLSGLTAFWRKYVGRMSAAEQTAFTQRAAVLFDWVPPRLPDLTVKDDPAKTALVLGLMPGMDSCALLRTVGALVKYRDEGLVGLDIVLLDQGSTEEPNNLALIVKCLRDAGMGCFLFPSNNEDPFPDELLTEHSSIDKLSTCCSQVARLRPGSEAWILADSHFDFVLEHDCIHQLLESLGATRMSNIHAADTALTLSAEQRHQLGQWIHKERVTTARHRVMRRYSLQEVRVLGCGSEAVVFTDGRTVFKCIDYWKTRIPAEQINFLRDQGPLWVGLPGIYPLQSVEEDGPWVMLTYEYEESTPYQGGHEDALIQLMDGCTQAGIVCNNIDPKNLVVTAAAVKLIDYGSDIRPWSPLGFEHMALRAFVTCRYANYPNLKQLMRRVLTDQNLPELVDYPSFRARLLNRYQYRAEISAHGASAPEHAAFSLHVGVITSAPYILQPLLRSLAPLRKHASIKHLSVLILDNACPARDLETVIYWARQAGLNLTVISESTQRIDAESGVFGSMVKTRPAGQVGIALGRTMIQRYLGSLMQQDSRSIGWILDDDMRIDDRAEYYLRWLPAFRDQGVDILLGAYEGSSPNPPLNGLRVQLLDLYNNLAWLKSLPEAAIFPDRSGENATQRAKYPDYYYDLSRKHSGHLEAPHWLEPAYAHETVGEARSRLLSGAIGILSGDPLTRSIIANVPENPLTDARDSVNRGGCTFILNSAAVTQTPNTIIVAQGREARRSDMIWAIVNRYYRGLTIKAVGFPINHVGRRVDNPSINAEKVQSEIVGSALYAGLVELLTRCPQHKLDFSEQEAQEICSLTMKHMESRLSLLERSFFRIAGLGNAIRGIDCAPEITELLRCLDHEFNLDAFQRIYSSVRGVAAQNILEFLTSMRLTANSYASASAIVNALSDARDLSSESTVSQGVKRWM